MTNRGFTITEVILSLGLISIIALTAGPFAIKEFQRLSLRDAQSGLEQALLTAQNKAMHNNLGDDWGVEVSTSTITTYKGNNFGGRDASFDLNWDISETVSASGTTSYVFGQSSYKPDQNGTTTFYNSNEGLWLKITEDGIISLE